MAFTLPDFSSLPGWKPAWGFVPGAELTAFFKGQGQTYGTWPPPEGAGQTCSATRQLTLPNP